MVLNPSHLLPFRRMDKFFPCGTPDAPAHANGEPPSLLSPCSPQTHSVVVPWLVHAPHEPLGHAAPATTLPSAKGVGRVAQETRATASTRTARNARPPSAKNSYMYDVPAATQRQPCFTPSSRHTAVGMIPQEHPARQHSTTWAASGAPLPLAPAARPARPATQKPPAAQNAANRPFLGHFITTQTTPLRHHARRGMRRRLSPAHGNRPKRGLATLNLPFHGVANTPPPASAICHQPGDAIPLSYPPLHAGAHMPGRPASLPCPAHATQSGAVPQRRPTPWPTGPCWRKISDLTLFSHLPLDIM